MSRGTTSGRSAPRRGQNLLHPFLAFLGSSRRQAKVRHRLVRLFEWKGFEDAEELADETLRRVARRMEMEPVESYTYLREDLTHRVFREVLHERTRREDPSRKSSGRSVTSPQPKARGDLPGSSPAQGLRRRIENVQDLFDPKTRRMDIGRLSAYLEVPRDRLEEGLEKSGPQASEALPRSSRQAPLSSIQRSLEILEQVLIAREAVLRWLRSPHPDLGQRPPLEVILQGYPDAVEDMLEAALEGIPS